MTNQDKQTVSQTFGDLETGVLDDLARRVEDIDSSYRAVAEMVGKL